MISEVLYHRSAPKPTSTRPAGAPTVLVAISTSAQVRGQTQFLKRRRGVIWHQTAAGTSCIVQQVTVALPGRDGQRTGRFPDRESSAESGSGDRFTLVFDGGDRGSCGRQDVCEGGVSIPDQAYGGKSSGLSTRLI